MKAAGKCQKTLPDHVSPEFYWDYSYDLFSAEGEDPYLAVSRLHEGPGIVWARDAYYGEPGWIVSRHDYVQEVFLDPEHFSSDRQSLKLLEVDWKLIPLELDPPEHHHYRKILNPYFTPAKIGELDDSVRRTCETLISQFENRGRCEFISEFAEKFPSYIFLDLMGLPREMLPRFLQWERAMLRAPEPAKRLEAMRAVLGYLDEFVREQMHSPETELLQGLVSARFKGERPLYQSEILGICYLLYIGGLDTVYSSLGWSMRYLASDRQLQQRLRDEPEDIPLAVDEFLRAFAVSNTHRQVKQDLVFNGLEMRAGDIVRLSTPAAGRDPLVYKDPHKIDIDRRARHLAFATGPHICLGMHLAKRELRTVIETFIARFHDIRIPEGERYQYHTGGDFGVDLLPLQWD